MSWRHSRAAGELPHDRPPSKAVLLALAHHANEYTGKAWPGIQRLMLFTALSKRAVQDALRDLEKLGVVTTVRGGGKRPSVYTLVLPGCDAIAMAPGPEVQEMHPPVQDVHPPGAGPAPEQSLNSQRTDARGAAAPLPDKWWPTPELIAWASKHFPSIDVDNETHLFVDNAAKKGETYVDPIAAWKSWCRRGEGFAQRDKGRASRSTGDARGGASLRARAAASRNRPVQ